MFRLMLLCLTLCVALLAQPRLPKRQTTYSPSLPAAQQGNVEKLKNDLLAIESKSQVTPQMKQQLAADLQAMAESAVKPSQSSIQKLVNDLTAAADKNLSSREIAQLSNDFYKVLNSAGISTSECNAVVSDAQAILKASGVSSADAAIIASDLKAIGAEVQKTAQAVKDGAAPGKFPRRQ